MRAPWILSAGLLLGCAADHQRPESGGETGDVLDGAKHVPASGTTPIDRHDAEPANESADEDAGLGVLDAATIDAAASCVSPTQNREQVAFPLKAEGCPCEITLRTLGGYCVNGIALTCRGAGSRWIAALDGPCGAARGSTPWGSGITPEQCALNGGSVQPEVGIDDACPDAGWPLAEVGVDAGLGTCCRAQR